MEVHIPVVDGERSYRTGATNPKRTNMEKITAKPTDTPKSDQTSALNHSLIGKSGSYFRVVAALSRVSIENKRNIRIHPLLFSSLFFQSHFSLSLPPIFIFSRIFLFSHTQRATWKKEILSDPNGNADGSNEPKEGVPIEITHYKSTDQRAQNRSHQRRQ